MTAQTPPPANPHKKYSDAQLLHWFAYRASARCGDIYEGTAAVIMLDENRKEFVRPLEEC